MMDRDHPGFNKNAEPFFSIVMEGLQGKVDGEHFWDAVAEDAVFEFLYYFPGFPNKIEGRSAYMDWFGGYAVSLRSADGLKVHDSREEGVTILEYAVHGTAPTGKTYDNRFCSIVAIKERKIVHWRDYSDSLAAMTALS